jgi:hypothetical protein
VFERFTDRARRVVVLAQEEARTLHHSYIGTEHLLLGLIHEGEGVAAIALQQFGVSLDALRIRVGDIIGEGAAASSGHIPFTPRAKKVLELSLRESIELGHDYIGTEHILLGLIREGEGVGAQVLQVVGDLSIVRQQVINLLSGTIGEGEVRGGVVVEEADVEAVAGGDAIELRPERPRRGPARRVERVRPNVRLRRAKGEPERMPICPRCDADLTESVRYRIKGVAYRPEDEAPSRRAEFLFCSECGRVVSANLLENED